jgi:SAM-dependent methyltransferase
MFRVKGSQPVLLRAQDVDRFEQFSQEYTNSRTRDGWSVLTPQQALALPFGQPEGYPRLYWEVRRQSFRVLMGILAREGPDPAAGPAADLGAGIGWLSYRLAQLGHRVLTVEASDDPDWGLGAAERYYLPQVSFLPVQGDLEHPPLLPGTVSLIVFNASLHYASDLDSTVRRAAEALLPGGRLVVLDTPIARQSRPGTGRGDRHFDRKELNQALTQAGLRPRWIPVRRGRRWWLHQAKALLKGDERFDFPLVLADRA